MKLFPILVLASSVLATPALRSHSERSQAQRMQRRSGRTIGMGRPMRPSNSKTETRDSSSSITYSTNWAGAVYSSPPSGESFSAVSASFIVPTPSVPSDTASTDGEYAAAIWVGIDGYTYSTAILQTGVDVIVSTSGKVSYDAWYEWYPDVSNNFQNIMISAGDHITASVSATSSTTGTATIENQTTGQSATITLSSTYALEGENAEWIVEDFNENNSAVAFADFGNVTFVNCVAETSSSSEGVADAGIMDLDNSSGVVYTYVEKLSDTSLLVSYNVSGSSSSSGGTGLGALRGDSSTSSTSDAGSLRKSGVARGAVFGFGLWAVLCLLA